MFPVHAKDSYKVGHVHQYPKHTQEIYSNFTARSGKLSNIPGSNGIWFVGLQHYILDHLIEDWNFNFFMRKKKKVVDKYHRRVSRIVGEDVDVSHISALHDLGYPPLEIKALPEGSFVPYGVPFITIRNTLPEFYWVTNMIESSLSCEMWGPITSATTYKYHEMLGLEYAKLTGADPEFVKYQFHDFCMRGMFTRHAAALSGAAVMLVGGRGTDNIPAIDLLEDYYGADVDKEEVGVSVNATEHSVMCAGGEVDEYETYRRLIEDIYPSGNISIVSDTWDFWYVVTNILPRLKESILKRKGKVIIRPDSGDPVDIVCGLSIKEGHSVVSRYSSPGELFLKDNEKGTSKQIYVEESKGLIECLWETFGGTVNEKGFKVLDPHIGAIYGDSITWDRANRIFEGLKEKGFASSNIVLGLGSFTYQYVTRDTHGMAVKSTNARVADYSYAIYKDPKTDNGTKKSARGYLRVDKENGFYKLTDQVSFEESNSGELETVFLDSKLVRTSTLKQVRENSRFN